MGRKKGSARNLWGGVILGQSIHSLTDVRTQHGEKAEKGAKEVSKREVSIKGEKFKEDLTTGWKKKAKSEETLDREVNRGLGGEGLREPRNVERRKGTISRRGTEIVKDSRGGGGEKNRSHPGQGTMRRNMTSA